MVRLFLYLAFCYVVWRILRRLFVARPETRNDAPDRRTSRRQDASLSNIQDAEFEDVTPKTPPAPTDKP